MEGDECSSEVIFDKATYTGSEGKIKGLLGIISDITERKQAEEILRKNHEMLKRTEAMANIGSWEWDVQHDRANWSEELFHIFGRHPAEGEPSFAEQSGLYVSEDIQRLRDAVEICVKRGTPYEIEVRAIRADGEIRHCVSRGQPKYDENGKVVRLFGSFQDITDRKRAEEQRQEGFDLLYNLARLVPGVIYQYRLYPDGRSAFPYSSPGIYDIYEVTPEEVREDASVVFGRLHPEDRDWVAEAIFESARTLNTFYCELRVILPEKGIGWRWSQAYPERTEDGGTLWHGIIIDITERKQAEQALQEQEERMRAIFESTQDAIFLKDTDLRYTH